MSNGTVPYSTDQSKKKKMKRRGKEKKNLLWSNGLILFVYALHIGFGNDLLQYIPRSIYPSSYTVLPPLPHPPT